MFGSSSGNSCTCSQTAFRPARRRTARPRPIAGPAPPRRDDPLGALDFVVFGISRPRRAIHEVLDADTGDNRRNALLAYRTGQVRGRGGRFHLDDGDDVVDFLERGIEQ